MRSNITTTLIGVSVSGNWVPEAPHDFCINHIYKVKSHNLPTFTEPVKRSQQGIGFLENLGQKKARKENHGYYGNPQI